eukprot:scaffold50946_cov66-Attheya_sp.AAC.1
MLEFVDGGLDISGYGTMYLSFGVIPLEGYTDVEFAGPILGDLVSAFECSDEVCNACSFPSYFMANDHTVKAIDNMERLINLCIPAKEVKPRRKMLWESCIPKYRKAMLKLRQHADFTDEDIAEDIAEFQHDFDLFFQDWIGLYGKNGLTNYMHLLSSGHISEYLYKWKNLYVHSQQGWESLNNQFKTMWFRRTGRGGAANGGKGPKSKLIPMG